MEVVKIKCPNCGGRLTVKLNSMNPEIMIPCPICKMPSSLKAYKQGTNSFGDETHIGISVVNGVVGKLNIQDSSLSPFQLKMGRNVVGRKATTSKADIQIPIQIDGRSRTSREHLVIDVEKVSGKGIVHYLSLYPKEQINETRLNGEALSKVDRVVLKHGDKITLPEAVLVFELPDEEATVF